MNAPPRDARTVIADQLGGSFESNGTDNDWTDQADAVLAALDDAGFWVAARPVVPTTREAAHVPGDDTMSHARATNPRGESKTGDE